MTAGGAFTGTVNSLTLGATGTTQTGSIAVSSTLGNGATFELRLAVAVEDDADAPLDHATP